jgi:hypothetical protein
MKIDDDTIAIMVSGKYIKLYIMYAIKTRFHKANRFKFHVTNQLHFWSSSRRDPDALPSKVESSGHGLGGIIGQGSKEQYIAVVTCCNETGW